MIYIIERTGWNQWLDEGDVWRSSRESARQFTSEEDAAEVAANLNEEFGSDDAIVVPT